MVAGEPLFELYSPTLVNAQEELLLALNRRLLDYDPSTTVRAGVARFVEWFRSV